MANVKAKYSLSLDLSKIDKSRVVSTDKNGQPYQNGAKYYSVDVIVFDEPSKYGSDVMVTEGQTKEERENKVKSNPIGNGKTVYTAGSQQQSNSNTPEKSSSIPPTFQNSGDLPF